MRKFLSGLLDWIYKKRCYCCSSSTESVALCSKCFDELDYNSYTVSRILKDKKVYVAGAYTKNLQKLIRGLKYHNKKELAYYIAKYMSNYFNSLDFNMIFQVIPVPLHHKRQKTRGYNQVELIAEEFCELTGNILNVNVIKRIKDTKPQYKLSKQERINNLSGAFQIDFSKLSADLPILLIDDICTTGSTFEVIISELEINKKYNIICFAATSPNI